MLSVRRRLTIIAVLAVLLAMVAVVNTRWPGVGDRFATTLPIVRYVADRGLPEQDPPYASRLDLDSYRAVAKVLPPGSTFYLNSAPAYWVDERDASFLMLAPSVATVSPRGVDWILSRRAGHIIPRGIHAGRIQRIDSATYLIRVRH